MAPPRPSRALLALLALLLACGPRRCAAAKPCLSLLTGAAPKLRNVGYALALLDRLPDYKARLADPSFKSTVLLPTDAALHALYTGFVDAYPLASAFLGLNKSLNASQVAAKVPPDGLVRLFNAHLIPDARALFAKKTKKLQLFFNAAGNYVAAPPSGRAPTRLVAFALGGNATASTGIAKGPVKCGKAGAMYTINSPLASFLAPPDADLTVLLNATLAGGGVTGGGSSSSSAAPGGGAALLAGPRHYWHGPLARLAPAGGGGAPAGGVGVEDFSVPPVSYDAALGQVLPALYFNSVDYEGSLLCLMPLGWSDPDCYKSMKRIRGNPAFAVVKPLTSDQPGLNNVTCPQMWDWCVSNVPLARSLPATGGVSPADASDPPAVTNMKSELGFMIHKRDVTVYPRVEYFEWVYLAPDPVCEDLLYRVALTMNASAFADPGTFSAVFSSSEGGERDGIYDYFEVRSPFPRTHVNTTHWLVPNPYYWTPMCPSDDVAEWYANNTGLPADDFKCRDYGARAVGGLGGFVKQCSATAGPGKPHAFQPCWRSSANDMGFWKWLLTFCGHGRVLDGHLRWRMADLGVLNATMGGSTPPLPLTTLAEALRGVQYYNQPKPMGDLFNCSFDPYTFECISAWTVSVEAAGGLCAHVPIVLALALVALALQLLLLS